jgi:hypothetical protein
MIDDPVLREHRENWDSVKFEDWSQLMFMVFQVLVRIK